MEDRKNRKSVFTSAAKRTASRKRNKLYLWPGAKVGCEWLSEHSTCSDESHKYSLFLFLEASPLLHKSKFFLYFLSKRVRIELYMFKYMMMLNLEVNK